MAKKQPQHTKHARKSWLRKWGSLGLLSMALAIIVIDTTLLNVSLGPIIRELHTDIQSIQWVITAYALTLTAFTITGGRLGDLFGRKRMFLLGAVLFAVGSLMASFSHSVGTLIIGESIIEGFGAALMMPATASLLLSSFSGRDRAVAFGVWGGVAGAASAVGPILGGWLTTNYSWRWGFRINVFVVIFLLAMSWLLKESRDTEEKPTLDGVGVVLSSLGLLGVVFGIIESSTYGWWKAKEVFAIGARSLSFHGLSITPISMVIGVLFLVAFFIWERRVEASGRTPLVSLKLFRNQQFTSGATTLAVVSLGLTGLIFALPVFFQGVRGQDALHTGLSLLPMSLSLFIAAPLSIVFTKWFTPKRVIQAGLALNIVAVLVLRHSITPTATATDIMPGLILFGLGMGPVMSQISNLTLSAVSVQEGGEASGVNNTMRQLGSALGSAVIGAVLITSLNSNIVAGIKSSSVIPDRAKMQVSAAVAAQSSDVEFGGGAKFGSQIPPVIQKEIKTISNQATSDAVRYALLYSVFFAVLSFALGTRLPNVKNLERSESTASGH